MFKNLYYGIEKIILKLYKNDLFFTKIVHKI